MNAWKYRWRHVSEHLWFYELEDPSYRPPIVNQTSNERGWRPVATITARLALPIDDPSVDPGYPWLAVTPRGASANCIRIEDAKTWIEGENR